MLTTKSGVLIIMRSSRDDSGFTLIEMVCVISLLTILMLIAVPALADFGENQTLEITARTLAIDLRKSQQLAITSGWTKLIEFRGDNNHHPGYRLKKGKTNEYILVTLPEGISYYYNNFPKVDAVRTLKFLRSGAPNPGGTVALQNKAGKILYIIVAPATGRVRVSKLPPANWEQ
jgi:prepilin-type N-terminal cleavage/methylation domain-containing protein